MDGKRECDTLLMTKKLHLIYISVYFLLSALRSCCFNGNLDDTILLLNACKDKLNTEYLVRLFPHVRYIKVLLHFKEKISKF